MGRRPRADANDARNRQSNRPFRWAALSGDPEDIRVTDEALLELFPADESLHRWIRMAQERVAFQGLPCRICWLGLGERDTTLRDRMRIAVSRDPGDTASWLALYEAFLRAGDMDAAEDTVGEGLRHAGSPSQLARRHARTLIERGDGRGAMTMLESYRPATLDPGYEALLAWLNNPIDC